VFTLLALKSGSTSCSDKINKCGSNPRISEMTGAEANIVCGEWETGPAPSYVSGEKYNIVLYINKIIRHPAYDNLKGPITGNDLAVFLVNDKNLRNLKTPQKIYPACLPPKNVINEESAVGIHAGWARPPPFHFIEQVAEGFIPIYRDFYKQWHYRMNIQNRCEDSQVDIIGRPLEFPSNSSYPPGTVCAREALFQCNVLGGDSGSPLMVREQNRPQRLFINGVLSFVKGCEFFYIGPFDDERTRWQIGQRTLNPVAYTTLSCFLPWVAKMYGMEYDDEYDDNETRDADCTRGSGDPLDGVGRPCTVTVSRLLEVSSEVECIFPYYYNGDL